MPAAPDPRTAARSFLQALGTVVDCVTAQRLFAQPAGYEPDVLYAVALGRTAEPVPLSALLVYHWQPNGVAGGPQFPHLHVSAELSARTSFDVRQPILLHSRHLPTGRVSLEAIIRLLIAEFGIAYRHRNWPSRLYRTESIFRQDMTQRP